MMMVLLVFSIVGTVLFTTFKDTSSKISEKANEEVSLVASMEA